jgi:hypothetical protein
MARPQMKMSKKNGTEPEEQLSQRMRPELNRYLLQVDRQTKSSYHTVESAESAGLAIKKNYPMLHVAVYDLVEGTSTVIVAPAA